MLFPITWLVEFIKGAKQGHKGGKHPILSVNLPTIVQPCTAIRMSLILRGIHLVEYYLDTHIHRHVCYDIQLTRIDNSIVHVPGSL